MNLIDFKFIIKIDVSSLVFYLAFLSFALRFYFLQSKSESSRKSKINWTSRSISIWATEIGSDLNQIESNIFRFRIRSENIWVEKIWSNFFGKTGKTNHLVSFSAVTAKLGKFHFILKGVLVLSFTLKFLIVPSDLFISFVWIHWFIQNFLVLVMYTIFWSIFRWLLKYNKPSFRQIVRSLFSSSLLLI